MDGIDRASAVQRFISIHERAFRYRGSLPHPPCTQNVIWTVFPRPIHLSSFQVRQFCKSESFFLDFISFVLLNKPNLLGNSKLIFTIFTKMQN